MMRMKIATVLFSAADGIIFSTYTVYVVVDHYNDNDNSINDEDYVSSLSQTICFSLALNTSPVTRVFNVKTTLRKYHYH